MKLIDRIKAKTSEDNRIKGQVSTLIGTGCAAILATGLIFNPIGIICLSVGVAVFGTKATFHALKTRK